MFVWMTKMGRERGMSGGALLVGFLVASVSGCAADVRDDTLAMTSKELACKDGGSNKPSFYPGVKLYVPEPQEGALDQIKALTKAGKKDKKKEKDAKLIQKLIEQPQAVWLEQGSPKEVKKQTKQVVKDAAAKKAVPVLVAYNIPFRDCAQFSAGGATTPEEYLAWIDGVAEGIGDKPAIIILEPDGLGIIPYWASPWTGEYDWCQPAEADPATAASDRLALLNAAVDKLEALPEVRVYLDATHSSWVGTGEIADRLIQAGVARATGFFLNASNYRSTDELAIFGRWISSCLQASAGISWWDPLWCKGQYNEIPPGSGTFVVDFSDEWVTTVDEEYAALLAQVESPVPVPFVIDTSRNGQGPWTPPEDRPEGDPQDWCNPPDRGLGLRPTTKPGIPWVDALLWIKTPGESDGLCNRWNPAGEPDPVRGYVNPPAGEWFPEQALELVHLAVPPL